MGAKVQLAEVSKGLVIFSCCFTAFIFILFLLHISGALSSVYVGVFNKGGKYERAVSIFDSVPIKNGDVVFLGDSITEGGAWDEFFENRVTRNRGIGGDTTSGLLARLHQINRSEPSSIFLMIGTNDIYFGVAEDEIVENILTIIDLLSNSSKETKIFLQSILPRASKYKDRVEAINKKVRERLPLGVTYIDLYPHFLDEHGVAIDTRFSNDALHLNGDGYLIWREIIKALVVEHG
ncbi:MAG: hypothetical protein CBC09_09685 [Cellvibrionales bacterium TMED49]|nr:sialate O-acetylesterase [Porticoccaceae bacterium]OUU35034.1 MAG: hypothetical protein CBC09_09685 [Cellvibrionales bacterium TMED49]